MVDFAIRLKCGDPPDLPKLSILVLQPILNRVFSITNPTLFSFGYDNYASARRVAPWQLNRQLICFIAEVPSNHNNNNNNNNDLLSEMENPKWKIFFGNSFCPIDRGPGSH